MSFDFSQKTEFKLKAKQLNYVTLGKKTWDHIIREKEREHIEYNEELLKKTLQNPDIIKEDEEDPNVLLYFKKVQKYYLDPTITINVRNFNYFTIVVQKKYRFIMTIYPSSKTKGGKQIWPAPDKK